MMKKILFLSLALVLCGSQTLFARGSRDLGRGKGTQWTTAAGERDTAGKCDEQYFSVIKLKIDRPKAIPFTINANGSKVEFSSGNLQYQASTKTFRFSREQWDYVGNGYGSRPSFTPNADHLAKSYAQAIPNGIRYTDKNGNTFDVVSAAVTRVRDSATVLWDSVVTTYVKYNAGTIEMIDTLYDTIQVLSNLRSRGPNYGGWIDLFYWATSGYDREQAINVMNKPSGEMLLDTFAVNVQPFSTGAGGVVHNTYNYYGIGPSWGMKQGTDTIPRNIDTTSGSSRNYDWGYYNNIYAVWKGYDTCKVTDATVGSVRGADSILWDSTVFPKGTWRTLTSFEWDYMLTKSRSVKLSNGYTDTSFVLAHVTKPNGKTWYGMLIFPDNFNLAADCPDYSGILVSGKSGKRQATSYNTVTYADYKLLEKQGVIFIPANYETISLWTATAKSARNAACVRVGVDANTYIGYADANYYRNNLFAVRLVRDVNPTTLETVYQHKKIEN